MKSKGTTKREDRILTKHPEDKRGVNILREKYDITKKAILDSLTGKEEILLKEASDDVHRKLTGRFDGSIPWYFTTVKLDLEARGIIQRIPGKRPQRIRLRKGRIAAGPDNSRWLSKP